MTPTGAAASRSSAASGSSFVHRLPGEYLPDYVGSWSGVANLDEAEKRVLLDEVRGWSVADVVELPFRIQALVGARIAPGSGRTR